MSRMYAEDTKVPVERTRNEIEAMLAKAGCTATAFFTEPGKAMIVFQIKERRIRFDLPLQPPGDRETSADKNRREKHTRARWRALGLCIKAKLESVASAIETFDEAFLAHIVLDDGHTTVGSFSIPQIAAAAKTGRMPALLPPPRP